jgi:hypothetical protein
VNLFFIFLLLSFAVYRATRLIVLDDFPLILWFRGHLTGEDGITHWSWVPEWLATLASCQYCASAYVSLGAIIAVAQFISLPLPILWWFSVWGSSVLIFNYETRAETPNYDQVGAVQDYLLEAIRERDQEIVALKKAAEARPTKQIKNVNLPPNIQDI